MAMYNNNVMGQSGFNFFVGVVEDRHDPMKLGRVRVRCFGNHTASRTEVPIDALPWAQCAQPVNGNEGNVPDMKEGTNVWGFFMDGDEMQVPFITGVVPGNFIRQGTPKEGFTDPRAKIGKDQPGTPRYIRDSFVEPSERWQVKSGSPTISGYNNQVRQRPAMVAKAWQRKLQATKAMGGSFDEPKDPYNGAYPFVHASQTESGHAMEFDDTPGKERVHIFHRAGSYIEVHPSGTVVKKSIFDDYAVVLKDQYITVSGNSEESIELSKGTKVEQDYRIEVAKGKLKIQVNTGNIEMVACDGAITLSSMNDINITSNENISLSAKKIFLNGGSGVTPPVPITTPNGFTSTGEELPIQDC